MWGPPRRGHRSRPIPSALHRAIRPPVRPLGSLPRLPVDSGAVEISALGPLPSGCPGTRKPSPGFRSPSGFPPKARSAQPGWSPRNLLLRKARLPFAPRPPCFLSPRPAAHRSGLATFREARCSVNLLEPRSSCSETEIKSMGIHAGPRFLHTIFLICFQYHGVALWWNSCE